MTNAMTKEKAIKTIAKQRGLEETYVREIIDTKGIASFSGCKFLGGDLFSVVDINKETEIAKKRYNNIMFEFCLEYLTVGTSFSEGTEGWGIKEMVTECRYQYDVCYEHGNLNNEGESVEELREMYSDEDTVQELRRDWVRKTRLLRNFIRKYEKYC